MTNLLVGASTNDVAFDAASPASVDLAVSLALTSFAGRPLDTLRTLALCVHVLLQDGQFARVQHLTTMIRSVADAIREERSFLAAFLDAFTDQISGRHVEARARLGRLLTPSDETVLRPHTRENLSDLLVAAAFSSWLERGDLALIDEGRQIALDRFDDLALLLLDLQAVYVQAHTKAGIEAALATAQPSFAFPPLDTYVQRLGVATLFPAQLAAIEAGVLLNRTRVVSLPTSSGKTLIAELRIASAISSDPAACAIYISPYRLLSRQVERTLQSHLRPLGYRVEDLGASFEASLFGDESLAETETLVEQAIRVGIMTPERIDGILRLSRSTRPGHEAAQHLLGRAKVIVIDEMQLIARPGRGPRFEVLIARIRDRFPELPILGLAALSSGVEPLANWLGDDSPIVGGKRPTGTLEVSWAVDGRLWMRHDGEAELIGHRHRASTSAMDDAADLALACSRDSGPVLIVEAQRHWAESVGDKILTRQPYAADQWRSTLNESGRRALDALASDVERELGPAHRLSAMLRAGIAYHHAGVPSNLLRGVERLVRNGCIRVVVATTTVAEGADLPFRVVIVPHLNFQAGALDRGLYQNLVGRAGRAGVAIEGLVFVMESDARTLKGHVRSKLWSDQTTADVRGQLDRLGGQGTSPFLRRETHRNVESQVLAWIDELSNSPVDLPRYMAERTLTWLSETDWSREATVAVFSTCIDQLLSKELVVEDGPAYRLTSLGHRARLAGLSAASCQRLEDILSIEGPHLLGRLAGKSELDEDDASALSWLVFHAEEVLEKGLWVRGLTGTEAARYRQFRATVEGDDVWPDDAALFRDDVGLVTSWIRGLSYEEIGSVAPTFPRGRFSKTDASTRASDAAEYINGLTYPAGWAWSACRVLAGDDGDQLPGWVRAAFEAGVPSETAAEATRVGTSRTSALLLSKEVGPTWMAAKGAIETWATEDYASIGIPSSDARRLTGISG